MHVCRQTQVEEVLDYDKISSSMEGFSGDDVTNVCRDAALNGMRRKIAGKSTQEIRQMSKDDVSDPVSNQDFDEALRKISARFVIRYSSSPAFSTLLLVNIPSCFKWICLCRMSHSRLQSLAGQCGGR